MTLRRLLAATLIGFACLTAAAAGPAGYVELAKRLTPAELAAIGLTPEQVARLDDALRAAQGREAAMRPERPHEPLAESASRFVGLDVEPLVARVKGGVGGWSPGTVFVLDNGQQWKVLKGTVSLPRMIESPTVRLVPGIAGRWFLELDEDHPKARVYRID